MTQEKAREYFSAYYEGALEPGLRHAFEFRLHNDATLQADFAAFVETMEELEMLPQEEIEVPMFLNDRIATRLEQERSKRTARVPVWTLWLRGLAFGGLATAAIAGAFISIGNRGGAARADLLDGGAGDRLAFANRDSTLMLDYHPATKQTVVISSGVNGKELKRIVADASSDYQPFNNDQPGTALFNVQVDGQSDAALVAIPGTKSNHLKSGTGTMRDFAASLADYFRTSVVLRVSKPDDRIAWKFDGTDVRREADDALAGTAYTVDQRETGVLNITDR